MAAAEKAYTGPRIDKVGQLQYLSAFIRLMTLSGAQLSVVRSKGGEEPKLRLWPDGAAKPLLSLPLQSRPVQVHCRPRGGKQGL